MNRKTKANLPRTNPIIDTITNKTIPEFDPETTKVYAADKPKAVISPSDRIFGRRIKRNRVKKIGVTITTYSAIVFGLSRYPAYRPNSIARSGTVK